MVGGFLVPFVSFYIQTNDILTRSLSVSISVTAEVKDLREDTEKSREQNRNNISRALIKSKKS